MRPNKWLAIFLPMFLLGIEGCKPQRVLGKPLPDNELEHVKMSYVVGPDLFPGRNAYTLFLENSSDSDLEDCVLTINDEYVAQLKDMTFDYGFWRGTHDYGSNTLRSQAKLSFQFSHDITGHLVFQNTDGQRFSLRTVITKIRIDCKEGVGEWQFKPSTVRLQLAKGLEVLALGLVILLVLVIVLVLQAIW